MLHINFEYYFYAVGQGLFSTGYFKDEQHSRQFNWLFDCGTVGVMSGLRREIGHFQRKIDQEVVELFCLSHFDEDHINGAEELLSCQRVDTLVMPYFTLAERLQLALTSPTPSDEYIQFLVDPAGYMFAVAGDNLRRIIFITGGGSFVEEFGDDNGRMVPPHQSPDSHEDWKLNLPNTEPDNAPDDEDIYGISDPLPNGQVVVLGHQQPLTVGGVWEFFFYNQHIPNTKAIELRRDVLKILRKFRRNDGSFKGTELLRELKSLYASTFGDSSVDKNKISLVMYSGPLASFLDRTSLIHAAIVPISALPELHFARLPLNEMRSTEAKVSILYFGDFTLRPKVKLLEVQSHFSRQRWNQVEVIQVPHHGSSLSWYAGASAEFFHRASVVSAGRTAAKHPGQLVIDDLSTHGLVSVNELQRVALGGSLGFDS